MPLKDRRRDVKTRLSAADHERVKRYADQNSVTFYRALERLILLGLGKDESYLLQHLAETQEQLRAAIDCHAELAECIALGTFASYSYARETALSGLDGENRKVKDEALLKLGKAALTRQLHKKREVAS